MRYFPHGFYADLGLRLSHVWEAFGDDVRQLASTPLAPRFFEKPRWLDAGCPRATPPRPIFVSWQNAETLQ
jgi:hypothetical protein